ncbi:MAG: zinc ribbon domain-containing protein [Dehalococcoidia bacterium]|nr:zinc ribbon domain-containing protein [Dehalococcoidia bacterium]
MPIYEYRCESCQQKFAMLNRSFSEIKEPLCTRCGAVGGTRIMSQITVIRSPNDFMAGMPSWESMTDFDEDDPRSVADMVRRMKDETGEDIGPEGEEMLARIDAGKMMEDMDDGGDFGF